MDVVDERKQVAASPSKSVPNRRWRVRDNLPGTAAFCPIVRKTRDWTTAVAVDVHRLLQDLAAEFAEEGLLRSAVWMTLRESKASPRRSAGRDSGRTHHTATIRTVPISGLITKDAAEQRAYTRLLDMVSRPLMTASAGHYGFTELQTTYPDGIHSNFKFSGDQIARPLWRYLDLTQHVVWLAEALKRTIHEYMRHEAHYLQQHAQARAANKEIIEMPNLQIDRIIRSTETTKGKLSNALAKEMPVLTEPGLWDAIAVAFHQPAGGAGEVRDSGQIH